MSEQPKMKVHPNGSKDWWLNGEPHRTDGPAYEGADGSKAWFLNGNRHRTDGPAWEGADGSKMWFLDGEQVSWRVLYRQANDPETELRILLAALTIT
jgi:hypothetical protein